MARYLIHNTMGVDQESGRPLYWSNDIGWTEWCNATIFTAKEKDASLLPEGGRWISWADARDLDTDEHVEQLVEEYLKCDGKVCPICGRSTFQAKWWEVGECQVTRKITCMGCFSTWYEEFTRTAVKICGIQVNR